MIYFEDNFVGENYNLEHPRVLWNSISRRATVAASTEATGYDAVNTLTATTYDEWKPVAMPATWTLTFDATETINAIAMDTHTLGTDVVRVLLQEWDGSAWVDLMEAEPTDDEPIALLFRSRTTDRIRLRFFGSVAPRIAVIHCCEALEIPQTVYMGAPTPVDMARESTFENNKSVKGNFLGRSVLYSKNNNKFTVAHLTEYFVRVNMTPFILDAIEFPYFLLERPYSTPEALSYRFEQGNIVPVRMGINNLMQVDL